MPRTAIDLPDAIDYLSILDANGQVDTKLMPDLTADQMRYFHRIMLLSRRFDERLLSLIGKSRTVREGRDLTMITYGAMLRRTLEAAERLAAEDGVEAEVIDLLTISPLDDELFTASVRKTGHVVIVHEACRSFGPGAEIIARLVEKTFFYLEAPIQRVTGFDVIFPYFAREQAYLPDVPRILDGARAALQA
jgi:pyruvate dehydrogenase E1 component beta subunit